MAHDDTINKPWYKKWWGILLIIGWFPITIPWLIWKKTSWSKNTKIVAILVFFILIGLIAGKGENKQNNPAPQTQEAVQSNNEYSKKDELRAMSLRITAKQFVENYNAYWNKLASDKPDKEKKALAMMALTSEKIAKRGSGTSYDVFISDKGGLVNLSLTDAPETSEMNYFTVYCASFSGDKTLLIAFLATTGSAIHSVDSQIEGPVSLVQKLLDEAMGNDEKEATKTINGITYVATINPKDDLICFSAANAKNNAVISKLKTIGKK